LSKLFAAITSAIELANLQQLPQQLSEQICSDYLSNRARKSAAITFAFKRANLQQLPLHLSEQICSDYLNILTSNSAAITSTIASKSTAIIFAFERANAIIAKLTIMYAPKPHKLEIQA
jgi:hypothetical protein